MPAIETSAAMVKTPMPGFLTLAQPRCKRRFGASVALTETDRSPGGGCLRRGGTGRAFFALVGVSTAVCKTPGQRVGCWTPATAGDIDAR